MDLPGTEIERDRNKGTYLKKRPRGELANENTAGDSYESHKNNCRCNHSNGVSTSPWVVYKM